MNRADRASSSFSVHGNSRSYRRLASAKLAAAIAAAVVATAIGRASAETITWGVAQNMTGDSDVLNNGTYFDAITMYQSGSLSVNGVTFNSATISGNVASDGTISVDFNDAVGDYTVAFTTNAPSSTTYSNLVNTGAFGNTSTNDVTIAGLTVGHTYQVESWSFYSGDPNTTDTTYTGTNSVSLNNAIGQYAVGTFLATSTSESFNYESSNAHNFVNDVSVRDLTATPEPASAGFLAMAAAGLLLRRQRNKGRRRRHLPKITSECGPSLDATSAR